MKFARWVLAVLLLAVFMVFALGSGESESGDQGSGSAATKNEESNEQKTALLTQRCNWSPGIRQPAQPC